MRFNKNLLKVNEYSLDGEVSGSDFVIGEDADKSFETINFTLNQLSIEVWGIGEAGQVLTATGDGRYVWTDDASEPDIPSTTTSTTAAPTTTTTTAATTTTTTSYSDPTTTTTTTTAAATTSTTTASSQIIATTTTTTAFVNPINGQCYKNDPAFNGGGSGPAMLSYFQNGMEVFMSYQTIPLIERVKVGDKIIRSKVCHTVACLYPTTPKIGGGKFLRVIDKDGFYGYGNRQVYPSGFCVDPDPDNITTTTTTTQAPTTTTTTPAPTTTTTTLSDFTFPPLCNYAIWNSFTLNGCFDQIVATYLDDVNTYLLRSHNYWCRQLSSEVYPFSSTPETIVVNFYNVNGSKIGVDYYYETRELGMPASQGEISAKRNSLGIHSSYFILSELDIFGNDPIADLGYSKSGPTSVTNSVRSQPNNLDNISITFKHANSGGSNECDVVVPTTTTTTTAPTTTTTTIAPTTTTTTSSVPSFSITNVNLSSLYYYSSNTDPSLYLSWSSATITTSGISSWSDLPSNGCDDPNSSVKEFNATFNVGGVNYGPYVARYSTAHSSVGNINSFVLSTFITGQPSSSNPNTLTEIQFSDNLWGTRCSSLTDLSNIFSNFTTSDTFTLEYIPLT